MLTPLILAKNIHGSRGDVIAMYCMLFIACTFSIMSVIAFMHFGTGTPVAAMVMAFLSGIAFGLTFRDALVLTVGSVSAVNQAMAAEDMQPDIDHYPTS